MTSSDFRPKQRSGLMLADRQEEFRAAEAVVDAAIWCQLSKEPVSFSDSDREFLIKLIKANPQLTGALFKNGLFSLS